MPWTIFVSTAGGVASTLLGVWIGGMVGRRAQERHWLKDTMAAAYRSLLREYARIEFDLRKVYLGRSTVSEVDWARWGAAATELSLVSGDGVVQAAEAISIALINVEQWLLGESTDPTEWQSILEHLTGAQMRFVNAARRDLSAEQSALDVRLGGPPLP